MEINTLIVSIPTILMVFMTILWWTLMQRIGASEQLMRDLFHQESSSFESQVIELIESDMTDAEVIEAIELKLETRL